MRRAFDQPGEKRRKCEGGLDRMGSRGVFVLVAPPPETRDLPEQAAVSSSLVAWKQHLRETSLALASTPLPPIPGDLTLRRPSPVFCNRPSAASGIGQRYRQFRILSKILCAMRYVRGPVQGRNCARRMRRCRAHLRPPPPGMKLHQPMHVRRSLEAQECR